MEKKENSQSKKNKILVEVSNLTKKYGQGDNELYALKQVNVEINRGELVVITGSSGSGKSTLLNMLGGMDLPDEGCINVEGQDISKMKEKERTLYRRNKVGFVFQSYNLIMDLTVDENIKLSADLIHKKYHSDTVLSMVGLLGRGGDYPTQLSGGQLQRVAIARAIVKDAKLILCDEPTGALDSSAGIEILRVFEHLVRKEGYTIVIVTHTTQIAEMADHVIVMKDGNIVKDMRNLRPVDYKCITW